MKRYEAALLWAMVKVLDLLTRKHGFYQLVIDLHPDRGQHRHPSSTTTTTTSNATHSFIWN